MPGRRPRAPAGRTTCTSTAPVGPTGKQRSSTSTGGVAPGLPCKARSPARATAGVRVWIGGACSAASERRNFAIAGSMIAMLAPREPGPMIPAEAAMAPTVPTFPDDPRWQRESRIAWHFALQQDISDVATILRHAADAGVPVDALTTALGDGSAGELLLRSERNGRRAGVHSTPSWLLEGRLVS